MAAFTRDPKPSTVPAQPESPWSGEPPAARAPATEPLDGDPERQFGRVLEERSDGRVSYECSLGWPERAVALRLPRAASPSAAPRIAAPLPIARGLAETCAGTAVTVNRVLPGSTLTEGARDFFGKPAREHGKSFDRTVRDDFARARPTSLSGRFVATDEVAATVACLCSPQAAATTGAAVRIDGGVVRSIA